MQRRTILEKLNDDLLKVNEKIQSQQKKMDDLKSQRKKIEEQIRSVKMDVILRLMDSKNLTVEKLEEIINAN